MNGNKRILKVWLVVFVALLSLFILLQVPAAWLLKKFAPNVRNIHNITGNIWVGQADWQVNQLKGTLHWTTRPWDFIRLRAAADVTLRSGQTELKGIVAYSMGKTLYVQNLNGEIGTDTLQHMVAWQWPTTQMKLQDIEIIYNKSEGFTKADGQMTWAGGNLHYQIAQRYERIDVPPLIAKLNAETNKLKLAITNTQQQRMADISLGADQMLDVQLTQRFLLHSPSYKGQAGLDTAVVTTRQPLRSLGGM